MTTTQRRVMLGGMSLGLFLVLLRAPSWTPAGSQSPGLDERVQQLERRLAAAEARLAALEALVPRPSPVQAAELTAYRTEFTAIVQAHAAHRQQVAAAAARGASAAELQSLADQGATLYPALAARIRALSPPACYDAAHTLLLQAANQLEVASVFGVGTATTSMTESVLAATLYLAQQALASARC